jgi:hypothetical protein
MKNATFCDVTANVVPSSQILVTLIMVACSYGTLVLTSATWHNIPNDVTLHSHPGENLKSYMALTSRAL